MYTGWFSSSQLFLFTPGFCFQMVSCYFRTGLAYKVLPLAVCSNARALCLKIWGNFSMVYQCQALGSCSSSLVPHPHPSCWHFLYFPCHSDLSPTILSDWAFPKTPTCMWGHTYSRALTGPLKAIRIISWFRISRIRKPRGNWFCFWLSNLSKSNFHSLNFS